jgi:hypothetical protein
MGEDGIAGISDEDQQLCFALAFWNGKDAIIKERMFGLNNREGNHGEDLKEYFFYLDNTPTHSYMKYLYKYPQSAFPYCDLVQTNRQRTRVEPEYELLDTGVFEGDRYFDIFMEYAKSGAEDILVKITAHNRAGEPAVLHVLPTFWFRNTWSWVGHIPKPVIHLASADGIRAIAASHLNLGDYYLYCENDPEILFTENETNNERIFGTPNRCRYVKDAFDRYLIQGARDAVNPECSGTKACAHYDLQFGAGEARSIRLRITNSAPDKLIRATPATNGHPFGVSFDDTITLRLREADYFYASITPETAGTEEARIIRQSMAAMLWSKQYYYFDVNEWVKAHRADPKRIWQREGVYREWLHMLNGDIISVPDKWEYPWYTSWDLAFNSLAISLVDIEYAKQQLELLLQALYLHPNGQMPTSELNFGEITPPIHAWSAMFLYNREKAASGDGDLAFLKRVFRKLMSNLHWWVNQKDRFDKNVFQGGFLGLENISLFDRSRPLPTGGCIEEADAASWVAVYCQGMLEMAVELSANDPSYQEAALQVVEYMVEIASVVNRIGDDGLWDETDGFYYDLLRFPDGASMRLKVRSVVGLLPLCATSVVEKYHRDRCPMIVKQFAQLLTQFPSLRETMHPIGQEHRGFAEREILAVVNPARLKRILEKLFDEKEFLSPYGIRSVSLYHAEHPYIFKVHGDEYGIRYKPGESDCAFSGNNNWGGPVWLPINILIIRALLNFYLYYGDTLKVEFPTGSHNVMNLFDISKHLSQRLARIFVPNEAGRRPAYGNHEKFHTDPNWRDCLSFFEYFNADTGQGLGASHHTGWTGLIALLINLFGSTDAKTLLQTGKTGMVHPANLSKVA